jgi:hypothetical protein
MAQLYERYNQGFLDHAHRNIGFNRACPQNLFFFKDVTPEFQARTFVCYRILNEQLELKPPKGKGM